MLFCLGANRFFAGCNLYVGSRGGVTCANTFNRLESQAVLSTEMVQAMVLSAVRRAAVVAPALQAVIDGVSVREAISMADRVDDALDLEEVLGRSGGGSH